MTVLTKVDELRKLSKLTLLALLLGPSGAGLIGGGY